MASIGGGAVPGHFGHHHGHGHPGVKIYNDVNVATPYHHSYHGYRGGSPYYQRSLPIGQGARPTFHPANRAAVGGADPLDPQHGIFGSMWKWTKNHKDDIINVATTVAGQVLGPQHGIDPEAHKQDAKILEIADKLEQIDKQEKEKEAELSGLMRKKHVLSSAIQARVMNSHLEHLASEAAESSSQGEA